MACPCTGILRNRVARESPPVTLHYSQELQRGLSIRSSVLLAAMQLEAVSNMLA
jgi:hypothetical protein